jgi:hypothetical protein
LGAAGESWFTTQSKPLNAGPEFADYLIQPVGWVRLISFPSPDGGYFAARKFGELFLVQSGALTKVSDAAARCAF